MGGCVNRCRWLLIVVCLAVACVCKTLPSVLAVARAQSKSVAPIRLVKTPDGGRRFEVSGLGAAERESLSRLSGDDPDWQRRLAVYAFAKGAEDDGERPAMLGHYSLENERLLFTPRFALEPGVRYRAVFRAGARAGEGTTLSEEFELPAAPDRAPAKIAAVFPSSDRLPENQLKFYLHFSAAMSRGEAYDRVHLLAAGGRPVELPFLELGEELWDPRGRRFTLLFDPGRIKRGLKPREEAGPTLEEGKTYTLVVDAAWRDAAGRPLAGQLRKTFSVGPPDDVSPDPANWKLKPPRAGEHEPLEARFPEPLDHALLERQLWVETDEGRPLAGSIAIDQQETRWRFTLRDVWKPGRYQLVVVKTLEDLAGNSVGRPFEVDELKPVTREVASEEVRLPFEVK